MSAAGGGEHDATVTFPPTSASSWIWRLEIRAVTVSLSPTSSEPQTRQDRQRARRRWQPDQQSKGLGQHVAFAAKFTVQPPTDVIFK